MEEPFLQINGDAKAFSERPKEMAGSKRMLSCLAAILVSVSTAHAIDRDHYLELRKKMAERAEQKDWQGARELLAEMGRELPSLTPRYMLTVASIEAKLGHKAEALQWLGKFAATGLTFDIAKDEELKGLLADPAGQKIVAQMKERSQPKSGTELVCSLPQADIMPEDITYLKSAGSKSGSFYVSSIQHHSLYRLTLSKAGSKECTMQELLVADEAKRWPTLAVSADPKRNVLWMTASAMPGFTGFPKEDEGKALLMEVDATTGKVLHSFAPQTTGPAVLGDMCVTEDGTVYVTDSIGGVVYRLRGDPQTAKLEKIADGLFSPQSPALARDGKRLFVADYTMGVAVIDLAAANSAARVTYLPHPENAAVVALDGFYRNGDSLIGIQNGTDPVRILRLRLDHAQTRITGVEVVEQATERMGDPTHAVLVDGWFYVSANVGWSKVDDNTGQLKPGEKFTPPVLLRFPAKASVN
jgi:sugar lactone lactonase YvrE